MEEPEKTDPARFEHWLRARGFAGAFTGFEPVARGWESEIWGFSLAGRPLVLREYHGTTAAEKAVLEHRTLELLGRSGFPVPEVIAVEADPDHRGRPFLVMERVDGPLLGSRPDHGADELGRLQVRLHEIDPQPLLRAGLPGYDDPSHMIKDQIGEWEGLVAAFGRTGFEDALDWAAQEADAVAPGRPGVAHWDLHPWNVIDEPSRGLVVIDWTATTVTDTRFDLGASLILWVSNRLPEARTAHLEAYRAEAGDPIENLEFFEATAAMRRLFGGVMALQRGPEALGMRSDAIDEIRDHVPGLVAVYRRWREVGGPTVTIVEDTIGD